MSNIGDSERQTQNRVIRFFIDKLHYTYLGNLHDQENSNIMQDRLHAYLRMPPCSLHAERCAPVQDW